MIEIVNAGYDSCLSLSEAPSQEVNDIITGHCGELASLNAVCGLVVNIQYLATQCQKLFKGSPPSNRRQVSKMNVDDALACYFVQQAFGGLPDRFAVAMHGRKIATAMDLFDWEDECGVSAKTDVKMKMVTASRVGRSMEAWMGTQQRLSYYEVTENLGMLFDGKARGSYGRAVKAVKDGSGKTERTQMLQMIVTISQMYLNTRYLADN